MASASSAVKISVSENGTFISIPSAGAIRTSGPITFTFGQWESEVKTDLQNPTPIEAQVAFPPQRKEAQARRAKLMTERVPASRVSRDDKGKASLEQAKRKAVTSPRGEDGKRLSVFSRLVHEMDVARYRKVLRERAQEKEAGWETVPPRNKLGRRARRNLNKRIFQQGESSGAKEASLLSQNYFHPLSQNEGENVHREGKAPLHPSGKNRIHKPINKPVAAKPQRQVKLTDRKGHQPGFDWSRLGARNQEQSGGYQQLKHRPAPRKSMQWVVKAQKSSEKGKALRQGEASSKGPARTTKNLIPQEESKENLTLSEEMTDEEFWEWINMQDDGLSGGEGPSASVCMVDTRTTVQKGVERLR